MPLNKPNDKIHPFVQKLSFCNLSACSSHIFTFMDDTMVPFRSRFCEQKSYYNIRLQCMTLLSPKTRN